MKIRYSVFLFVPFVISTYCALIPDRRVITNPDHNGDPNLVEGITYEIVHSKFGSNLDRDNNKGVYLNSESSSRQYWSFRKADGDQYNLINVDFNLNLDSNGEFAYVRDPSVSNLYQRWTFKKIKNDSYNIAHVDSGRNLDSNSQNVYVGDASETNLYQRWSFEPSNFNLSALITNFTYPPDLKDNLDKYKTRVGLLFGFTTIKNPTNATIEHTIDEIEVKSNVYTLEIRKSNSFKVTKDINVSFSISNYIFSLLGINTSFYGGIKHELTSIDERLYRETVTEIVSYRIKQKIIVPPLTSVMVNATVDKVSINIPFTADIHATSKADRLDESGEVVSMTNVGANAVRCYLQKENYDDKKIIVKGDSLIISTSGTLEVEGYGLDTLIEAYPIENPDTPKTDTVFYLGIISYSTILICLFLVYKYFKRLENSRYIEIP